MREEASCHERGAMWPWTKRGQQLWHASMDSFQYGQEKDNLAPISAKPDIGLTVDQIDPLVEPTRGEHAGNS
jgi:Flp pilus assembly CpaE family ATPase